jgi:hypothetical protein
MNKKIFDQLSADEKHIASKLNATAENMKILQDFQWTLESQLMDTYQNKSQPTANWFSKFLIPAGWAIAAVIGFVLLNWTIRSFVPSEQINPVAPNTEITVETFETKVRQGNICEPQRTHRVNSTRSLAPPCAVRLFPAARQKLKSRSR